MALRHGRFFKITSSKGSSAMLAVTLSLIFPLCLALAAFTDLFEMKIPNAIPLVLLIGFAILALVLGLPIGLAGLHLTAGLIVFFGCFTLFALNVMGGGDAKLLTAAAVWYGFNISLVEFLIEVAVFGGVLTLMILALRSQANTVMALGLRLPRSLIVEKKIPYGIAIAIGGFCSFLSAPVVTLALATVSPN